MTNYRQGEVILIPFPFTDFSTFKQRPTLVISANHFNKAGTDVIVATITSQIPRKPADSDYLIPTGDIESAGLPKASMIKPRKIVTIDSRLVREKIGAVSGDTMKDILLRFSQVII